MTEDQIERRVEKATDRYDAAFMSGAITRSTYDSFMRDLDKWAAAQYLFAAAEDRARARLGCDCGHPWDRHVQTANGAHACRHNGCGCRDVVAPRCAS